MHIKNIVAIGGGGFGRSLGSLAIEKYIISLVNKKNPKICFIPTASGDNDLYKLNFYRAFSKLKCITSHIDFFSRTEDLEEKTSTQDILYVGGGNTKSMLAVFREWGLDKILIKAYQSGKILAGVSAGAICWFNQGVTDSWAHGLRVMDCMDVLEGCCCPHYDGEKNRRPSVLKFIEQNTISSCLAIEDGAAVHYKDNKLHTAISFYEDKNAYYVSKEGEQTIEQKIERIEIY